MKHPLSNILELQFNHLNSTASVVQIEEDEFYLKWSDGLIQKSISPEMANYLMAQASAEGQIIYE